MLVTGLFPLSCYSKWILTVSYSSNFPSQVLVTGIFPSQVPGYSILPLSRTSYWRLPFSGSYWSLLLIGTNFTGVDSSEVPVSRYCSCTCYWSLPHKTISTAWSIPLYKANDTGVYHNRHMLLESTPIRQLLLRGVHPFKGIHVTGVSPPLRHKLLKSPFSMIPVISKECQQSWDFSSLLFFSNIKSTEAC